MQKLLAGLKEQGKECSSSSATWTQRLQDLIDRRPCTPYKTTTYAHDSQRKTQNSMMSFSLRRPVAEPLSEVSAMYRNAAIA